MTGKKITAPLGAASADKLKNKLYVVLRAVLVKEAAQIHFRMPGSPRSARGSGRRGVPR